MQKAFVAVMLLLALTQASLAATAIADRALNVRTGPGINFSAVDTLHAGETVTLGQCQQNWCYITHRGPDGWVSLNYLSSSQSRRTWVRNDPCDVDANTAFHMRFGLYYTPLARYCRQRDD